MRTRTLPLCGTVLAVLSLGTPSEVAAQRTVKPVLHGRHWVAITGKPLGAAAGAMMFARGGNAVDAAAAMPRCHRHDVGCLELGW